MAKVKAIDRLKFIERMVVIVCFFVMVAVIVLNVGLRYFFHRSLYWGQDVALICFISVSFLGASMAAQEGSLIRMDFLLRVVPNRIKLYLQLFIDIFVLCFLAVLLKSGIDLFVFTLDSTIPSMVNVSSCIYSISLFISIPMMLLHYTLSVIANIKLIRAGQDQNNETN